MAFPLDDCISPGYHTSLPLEVHGSSYSEMQMVSKTTYEKLSCPTIIVTQNTFDLEAFTYYVANYMCTMNNKKYGFFVDCACEIVKVRSSNHTLLPPPLQPPHTFSVTDLPVELHHHLHPDDTFHGARHRATEFVEAMPELLQFTEFGLRVPSQALRVPNPVHMGH